MKVGIIGITDITLDFANRASMSGYEVLISETCGNKVLNVGAQRMGNSVELMRLNEVAKAEVIVLSISPEDIKVLLPALPDMTEKIILHTNDTIFNLESKLTINTSYEIIASLLPTAHVVKVFNLLDPMIILPHREKINKNEIFYTAMNQYVKNYVRIFLESLYFNAFDLAELNQF